MKLISREKTLLSAPYFAYIVLSVQDGKYNPDQSPYEVGEMIETEEGTVIITKEDVVRLNREAAYEFQKLSDKIETPDLKKEYVDEVVFTSTDQTMFFEGYLKKCFNLLDDFFKLNNILAVTLLMDYAVPWLSVNLDGEEGIAEAQKALIQKGVNTEFDGGLEIASSEINTFLPLLFWYARYNDVFPEIYISTGEAKTTINLCPFGNMHFHCFNQKILNDLREISERSGFKTMKSHQCSKIHPKINA